jgi:hypothetical protein
LTEPEPMDESQAPTLQETPLVEPENTSTIQPTMQEKEPETVSMIAPTMQGTPLMEPEAISTTEPTMQGTPLVEPEAISTTEPTMQETPLVEPEAYIMDVTESVVTTAEEESPPLPSVLSPQLLKKAPERNQPVDVAKDDIPTDGEYSELKNYWAKAASKNTPTGLVPEKEARPTKKYFVFSDKPVAGATTKDAPSTPET